MSSTFMNKNIGSILRSWRLSLKLSQSAFARRCGLNRMSVVKFEKGETTPRDFTIHKIAESLDLKIDQLLKGPSSELVFQKDSEKYTGKGKAFIHSKVKSKQTIITKEAGIVEILNTLQDLDEARVNHILKYIKFYMDS